MVSSHCARRGASVFVCKVALKSKKVSQLPEVVRENATAIYTELQTMEAESKKTVKTGVAIETSWADCNDLVFLQAYMSGDLLHTSRALTPTTTFLPSTTSYYLLTTNH